MTENNLIFNYVKESESYRSKVKKILEWENDHLTNFGHNITGFLVFSVIPLFPAFLYFCIDFFYSDIKFMYCWGISTVGFGGVKLLLNPLVKKEPSEIPPEIALSVFSYFIHEELRKYSYTNDKDILLEIKQLNRKILIIWRKAYFLDGKLSFERHDRESAQSVIPHLGQQGIGFKDLQDLDKLQKVIPLFQVDSDADKYLKTISLIRNRVFLNLSAGIVLPEFTEIFLHLTKLFYLLKQVENSEEEFKEILSKLTELINNIPEYVPEKKESMKVFSSIKKYIGLFFKNTFGSEYKIIRFVSWLVTFGFILIWGIKILAVYVLSISYDKNGATLLIGAIALSGAGATALSSKENK